MRVSEMGYTAGMLRVLFRSLGLLAAVGVAAAAVAQPASDPLGIKAIAGGEQSRQPQGRKSRKLAAADRIVSASPPINPPLAHNTPPPPPPPPTTTHPP